MRIYSDAWQLYEAPIREALKAEQEAGRIAPHVTFKRLTKHRPRTHMAAYEIQLTAAHPGDGRRAGNSGSYGAMNPEYDGYAATYDEWGWLLAALFRVDPDMVVGSPSAPVYDGLQDFDERTGLSYNPAALIRAIEEDTDEDGPGDPYPFIIGKGGGAGRVGANRADVETAYRWSYSHAQNAYAKWLDNPAARTGNDHIKFKPRSVADVRGFAHLDAAPAPSA